MWLVFGSILLRLECFFAVSGAWGRAKKLYQYSSRWYAQDIDGNKNKGI